MNERINYFKRLIRRNYIRLAYKKCDRSQYYLRIIAILSVVLGIHVLLDRYVEDDAFVEKNEERVHLNVLKAKLQLGLQVIWHQFSVLFVHIFKGILRNTKTKALYSFRGVL